MTAGRREVPASRACPPVLDDLGGRAGVGLLERDGFDGGVRKTGRVRQGR